MTEERPRPTSRDEAITLELAFHRYNLPDKYYLSSYLRKLIDTERIRYDETIAELYGKLVSKKIRSPKLLEAVREIVQDLDTDDSAKNICRETITQLKECKNILQQKPGRGDMCNEITKIITLLEKFRVTV